MPGIFSLTYRDYDGEVSNVRIPTAGLTDTNWVAQGTLQTNLQNALAAITGGQLAKTVIGNELIVSLEKATDKDAQRELKWLVSYHTTADNKRYSVELPCADTAALDPNDRAHAAIGDAGVVDAFVAAFEAITRIDGTKLVKVDEITLVGRRV